MSYGAWFSHYLGSSGLCLRVLKITSIAGTKGWVDPKITRSGVRSHFLIMFITYPKKKKKIYLWRRPLYLIHVWRQYVIFIILCNCNFIFLLIFLSSFASAYMLLTKNLGKQLCQVLNPTLWMLSWKIARITSLRLVDGFPLSMHC